MLPGAETDIQETFSSTTITLPGRVEMQDIWIRDYGPFWKRTEEEPNAIKTYYYPAYTDKKYLKNSWYDNSIGQMMGWDFEYAECDKYIKHQNNRSFTLSIKIDQKWSGSPICPARAFKGFRKFASK